MSKTGRILMAVLAGAAVWTVLWNGGMKLAQLTFPDVIAPDRPLNHAGALSGYVLYSVVLSVLAGYITALAAGRFILSAVWTLAVFQLLLGVWAEASYWDMMPAWYHVVFLILIIPATVSGGLIHLKGLVRSGGGPNGDS